MLARLIVLLFHLNRRLSNADQFDMFPLAIAMLDDDWLVLVEPFLADFNFAIATDDFLLGSI